MMLDEFPALGRLDFFETALAFRPAMASAYLIAQSLNQISKAYGENNAILDNSVCASLLVERRADGKADFDALGRDGTKGAAQLCRPPAFTLARHVMVSGKTARPLLTPGEVMQCRPMTNSSCIELARSAPKAAL